MKLIYALLLILFVSCTPEITPLETEVRINIEYLADKPDKILKAEELLETYMSTQEFREFSNRYPDVYKQLIKDWYINILVVENSNLSARAPMSYNKDENTIKYRPESADNMSDNRVAAILLHEYLHQLGYHHKALDPSSIGYYYQYKFEDFLNKYNK